MLPGLTDLASLAGVGVGTAAAAGGGAVNDWNRALAMPLACSADRRRSSAAADSARALASA